MIGRARHILNLLIFALCLGLVSVANLLFHEKGDVAVGENRELAAIAPVTREALLDGSLAASVDNAVADRFAGRQQALRVADWFSEKRGPGTGVELVSVQRTDEFGRAGANLEAPEATGPQPQNLTADDAGPSGADANGAARSDGSPGAAGVGTAGGSGSGEASRGGEGTGTRAAEGPIGQPASDEREMIVNEFLIVEDQAMEVLGFRESAADYYAESVRRFLEAAGPEVQAWALVAPSVIEFIQRDRYGSLGADQEAAIRSIYARMPERVTGVAVRPSMEEAASRGAYLYFRSDHHWTGLGAYYAYRAFAESAGFAAVPISAYGQPEEIPNFLGSLYRQTRSSRLAENPDVVQYWQPIVAHEYTIYWDDTSRVTPVMDRALAERERNKYQVFISSDRPLGIIRTEAPGDRRILVFKDSYGNAFVPWLIPHYREIHVIDPRYFNFNAAQYLRENGVEEVLFQSSFAVVGAAIGYAQNIRRVTTLAPTPEPILDVIAARQPEGEAGEGSEGSDTADAGPDEPGGTDAGAETEATVDSAEEEDAAASVEPISPSVLD